MPLTHLSITHLVNTFYNKLEKDHSMIETRRLQTVVIFFQATLSLIFSSRKIYNSR